MGVARSKKEEFYEQFQKRRKVLLQEQRRKVLLQEQQSRAHLPGSLHSGDLPFQLYSFRHPVKRLAGGSYRPEER